MLVDIQEYSWEQALSLSMTWLFLYLDKWRLISQGIVLFWTNQERALFKYIRVEMIYIKETINIVVSEWYNMEQIGHYQQ